MFFGAEAVLHYTVEDITYDTVVPSTTGIWQVQWLPNSETCLNLIQQCFGFTVCLFLVCECQKIYSHSKTNIAKGMVQGRGHCGHIGISRVTHWRRVEHDERIILASFPWDSCYNQCSQCFYEVPLQSWALAFPRGKRLSLEGWKQVCQFF
jgi:hypothetical protein